MSSNRVACRIHRRLGARADSSKPRLPMRSRAQCPSRKPTGARTRPFRSRSAPGRHAVSSNWPCLGLLDTPLLPVLAEAPTVTGAARKMPFGGAARTTVGSCVGFEQLGNDQCGPADPPDQRLSRISTLWSLVCQAHECAADEAIVARHQLLERYRGAVYRYLRKLLVDSDAVDEVSQEFALHLIRGDLRGADPRRGRFRNFVKGTLFHLVADYCKQRRRWPRPLPDESDVLAFSANDTESDRNFEESWRDELLARAWAALVAVEATTGQPLHTVLRSRADHPEMRSPQLAERMALRLGRPISPAGVRQMLHRARSKFAALLLDEVTQSLDQPTAEHVQQELAELGLLEYCGPALEW